MLHIFSVYLGIGITAGLLAGLLGVGGGLVIVPALLFVFMAQDIPQTLAMHLAAGTSLASMCATSIASIRAHNGYNAVLWKTVAVMAPGMIAGSISGSMLSGWLSGDFLRTMFGLFVLMTAINMVLGIKPPPQRKFPHSFFATIAGMIIGVISACFGIGGGSLVVPYFIWCNIPVRQAVATAAACGLPLALAGTIGFLINGWNVAGRPLYSTGFVYWPAFFGIAITSVVFAVIGARLAHRLPTTLLRHIFVIFLCGVSLHLLWR